MSVPSWDSISDLDKISTSAEVTIEEDDYLEPWENLLQYLTVRHLEELRKLFITPKDDKSTIKFSKEEFVTIIDSVIDNSKYSLQAISLFNEIPYPEEVKITWNQFLDYYIQNALPRESNDVRLSAPNIFLVPHVKRETIMKIVLIETDTSFCYAVVSKYGKVGLYAGDFKLLATYKVIFSRTSKDFDEKYTQKKTVWVTDAIFLLNVRIFAVSSSARSIIFYDAAGQKHSPLWLVEGIPNAVSCLAYQCDVNSKLLMGDDSGSVVIMTFMQPKEGLLRKKYSDRVTAFFWKELPDESDYITLQTCKKIHTSIILSIICYPETFSFVSCSRDRKKSVVVFHLKENKCKYSFREMQGVSCFSLNHKLHILLTGSDNGSVKLWNLFVPSMAMTTFQGHKTAIVDVQILEFVNSAVSCSRDGVLKIWNLQTHICEYSTTINYPSFGILGKNIEWGTSTIYPGPKRLFEQKITKKINQRHESLDIQNSFENCKQDIWKRTPFLVTCCNYIAQINIVLPLNLENDKNYKILPPPPLQNDILIPDSWKLEQISSETEGVNTKEKETALPGTNKLHPSIREIMEIDFLKCRRDINDINYKIAALEMKKIEMRKPVRQCAPYLALDLYEMDEVKLSPNLPIPKWKKTQQIAERTLRLLSAASNRSDILTDRSSKSKSSRSSIIEF